MSILRTPLRRTLAAPARPLVGRPGGAAVIETTLTAGDGAFVLGGQAVGTGVTSSFYGDVLALGLTSGLQGVWDAGAIGSWPGSGQALLDLHTTDRDMYLGTTSGADVYDPTFAGTAGSLAATTYAEMDGTAMFSAQAAPGANLASMHKDGALWSAAGVAWFNSFTSIVALMATNRNAAADQGITVRLLASGQMRLRLGNTVSQTDVGTASTATFSSGAWVFWGISVDENGGASASNFIVNTTAETFNAAYTSPAAGDASRVFTLGGHDNGSSTMTAGSRWAGAALWTGVALTPTQLGDLRTLWMARFA